MRKIFLFFSAVLVSLAMQATVVTRDLGWVLDGTTDNVFTAPAWESASKWEWTPDVGDYDQLVVEVENHDYPIAVTVICTNGEGDLSAKNIMLAGTNSVAVNLTGSILKGVSLQNFSGNAVTITITGIYLRGAIGSQTPVPLWSGSQHFDDYAAWGSEIHLEASAFSDVHVGDMLEINYSLDEDTYYQFKIETPWNHNYPEFLGTLDEYHQYNVYKNVTPSQLTFTIMSSADLTNLQNDGGLYINAKHLTVTSITLHRHDVLWSNVQATGNWEHAVEVNATKLADLKVGNILCVRVSAIGTEYGPRVSLYCGWNPEDALADGEYYFQGGDEAPMVVEFPVTYKMEQQLRGKNLLVRGVNYTMTDIYVLDGSPVNTVAAYLNVSEAGMATYVLPFNVPDLPAGVQAYELTNDGSEVIMATEVSALEADKPVLIVAAEGEYEFVSEEDASDDISGKSGLYANDALIGTYQTIEPLAENDGAGNNNYILSNGTDGVAFYQVLDNTCSVAPYRAYLSCGFPGNSGAGAPKRMRIVFHKDAPTGMESQELKANSQKLIKNGQLFILRNGVEYNVNGQMTK